MAQSLMAIAAFMAIISGVIFGVSRFEKSKKDEDSISLVQPPITKPVAPEPPTPIAAKPVESALSEPVVAPEEPVAETIEPVASEPIQEPVAEEPVAEEPAEPIAETVATQVATQSGVAPEEPVATAESVETPEPRAEIAEFSIPPTIQDPKRPNDGKVEDLTQDILAWGQSKDLKHVPQLMQYATHQDAIVRSHVASSLGQIVSAYGVRGDVERTIPILGKLTNDSDLKVRQYAVQSLGMIRSEKVLPYLEKALQSPSGSVMKAANTALQNLKLQYGQTPSMQIAEKMLEKPKQKNC